MSTVKEVITEMLELYRDMPFLWDRKHPKYNNKLSRKAGYKTILDVYKRIDQYATVKTITKKIQNLRTSYNKEFKKIKASIKNGDEEVYKPTLWYYEALTFLDADDPTCNSSKDPLETEDMTASSSDADNEYAILYSDNEDTELIEQPNMSENSYMSPPKKKRTMLSSSFQREDREYFIKETKETAETYPKIKEEEWEILGKSIGIQLRDLNKKQLVITQKIISDAIYYGKLDMLSEKSFVALGPSSTVSFPNSSVKLDKQHSEK